MINLLTTELPIPPIVVELTLFEFLKELFSNVGELEGDTKTMVIGMMIGFFILLILEIIVIVKSIKATYEKELIHRFFTTYFLGKSFMQLLSSIFSIIPVSVLIDEGAVPIYLVDSFRKLFITGSFVATVFLFLLSFAIKGMLVNDNNSPSIDIDNNYTQLNNQSTTNSNFNNQQQVNSINTSSTLTSLRQTSKVNYANTPIYMNKVHSIEENFNLELKKIELDYKYNLSQNETLKYLSEKNDCFIDPCEYKSNVGKASQQKDIALLKLEIETLESLLKQEGKGV